MLDQALLLAGAQAVVSTRWRINDASTALFEKRFYDSLHLGRAEALAESQRSFIRSTGDATVARLTRGLRPAHAVPLSHPHHWASFVLVGDPR